MNWKRNKPHSDVMLQNLTITNGGFLLSGSATKKPDFSHHSYHLQGEKKQKEMVKSVEETRLNLGVWKQTLWFGRQTRALTMLQRP
jgi:hypothetical protein